MEDRFDVADALVACHNEALNYHLDEVPPKKLRQLKKASESIRRFSARINKKSRGQAVKVALEHLEMACEAYATQNNGSLAMDFTIKVLVRALLEFMDSCEHLPGISGLLGRLIAIRDAYECAPFYEVLPTNDVGICATRPRDY